VDASGGGPAGDDGGGCGCGAAGSPVHDSRAWRAVALVLLLLRRRPRVRHHT
jgi:hypothetical protein